MSQTPVASRENRIELYEQLLLPRIIEEKMLRLIRQGRLSKWFSGYGQEAISVGCASALRDDDYLLPLHRNLGVWTTRRVPLEPLFRQLMGRDGGFTRGRDRTFHFGLPEHHIIGMISHLGAMLPVACGLALAARLDGRDRVTLALIGEGATREGDFHESLSLAALWKLPVLFVVENNLYGLSTPASEALPVEDIALCAAGYGMPGHIVDGNDLDAVRESVRSAADRARSGAGPTLLEMKTFRMRGHEEASGTKYVPVELFEAWGSRDPVERFRRRLMEEGVLSDEDDHEVRDRLTSRIEAVAEDALAAPDTTSTVEAEMADVFAPATASDHWPEVAATGDRELRYVDAVRDALSFALEHDERVVLLGQDIAEYGGVFKATEGLAERFGRERVRNTPIIESGAVGAALGMALEGFRPVLEIQYADFISVGFNQVVNNLATTHYRWNAPVNVTIRAPYGGGIGAGPFHSQAMEAWFAHVPGLKVVIPTSPADARGLLLAAIADPNPVLVFEHKFLYRSMRGAVPPGGATVPIGRARIVRAGDALTIVTYGVGVVWAEEEARYFEEQNIRIEVVDLRTIVPWDRETVLASVRKTHRAVILHEAPRLAGFGGEIAATIAEEAFTSLDAPPVRVGALETPVPFARRIEDEVYSARSRLRRAISDALAF